MIERIIYQCEHCNRKRYFNKTQMKTHEEKCWHNIKNKTCVTCGYKEYDEDCNLCTLKKIKYNMPFDNCNDWIDKLDYLYGEE